MPPPEAVAAEDKDAADSPQVRDIAGQAAHSHGARNMSFWMEYV
jgi:hypothetical protein